MNSPQLRRQRRVAARQESMLEPSNASAAPSPNGPSTNPELLDEFTPELMAEANRARAAVHARAGLVPNAPRRSTGPITENGKQISSRNSLKHGLAGGELIIAGEQRAGFEALLADLLAEHQPASPTEELLVLQMAQSFWLSQRALRLQAACCSDDGLVDMRHLALLLRYQTSYERSFHKALTAFIRLKKERVSDCAAAIGENVPTCPVSPSHPSRNEDCPARVPKESLPDRSRFVSQDAEFVSQKTSSALPEPSHSPAPIPLPLVSGVKEVAA